MTKPIYAVGDIHGQTHMFDRALELIHADGGPDATIVFLGDYVDRGVDCAGVIDRLIDGQKAGKPWITIKGNHDRMFEWFMEDTPRHDPHLLVGYHWFHDRIGGRETLASYGIDIPDRIRLEDLHAQAKSTIPQAHVEFLRGLPYAHETDELFFVHAGIRPHVPLNQQAPDDMVWIREPFFAETGPHPKLIVHGHTALDHPEHFGNRIDLDGGAAYGRMLHPAVFEGNKCWLLKDGGRELLAP